MNDNKPRDTEESQVKRRKPAERKGDHTPALRISRVVGAGLIVAAVVTALVVGVFAGQPLRQWWQASASATSESDQADVGAETDAAADVGVQFYQSGMHPWIITTEPGDCPICGMALEPIDPTRLATKISIDPTIVQNIGVRTTSAVSAALRQDVRTFGEVTYAAPKVSDVTVRVSGWIETLHADAIGQSVKKGQTLFEMYSPEAYAAQEEYLLALRQAAAFGTSANATDATGVSSSIEEAAREKLRLLDVSEAQIDQLVERGSPAREIVVHSPRAGVVVDRPINEGMFVTPGTRVVRIADLSEVWVEAKVFERDLAVITVGQSVAIEVEATAASATMLRGEVSVIEPAIDRQTRQATVRVRVGNKGGALRPGMSAAVRFWSTSEEAVTQLPREAVMATGDRYVAFVSLGRGAFEPRTVTVGRRSDDGMVEITSGVKPGEQVVISGQFLLDSEARLRESLARMVSGVQAGGTSPKPSGSHAGH